MMSSLAVGALYVGAGLNAQQTPPAPDNTRANQRDRAKSETDSRPGKEYRRRPRADARDTKVFDGRQVAFHVRP